nr:MAG TPA: hypothetical protein [Caudoviricetes sp.]
MHRLYQCNNNINQRDKPDGLTIAERQEDGH